MAQIYEGLFLLDNDVVREDWRTAKALVTDTLVKNGATVHCARRWDERKLAYAIKRRQRATYLIVYYEIPIDGIGSLIRDLDLSERVLRYLLTCAPAIPEGEAELAAQEEDAAFELPAPPPDDAGVWSAVQGPPGEEDEEGEESADGASGAPESKEGSSDAPKQEAPAAESETKPEPVAAAAEGGDAETTKEEA